MALRLRGQETQIRAIANGVLVNEVSGNITTFNDSVMFEIKEDGFIGEVTNRFDDILNGYSGDFEFQVQEASWLNFVKTIELRATRQQPDLIFSVIRTDLFANGGSAVIVWIDVKWGAIPTSIAGRVEHVKVKGEFKSSQRSVTINQIV